MALKERYENTPIFIIFSFCLLVLTLLGAIIGGTYVVLEKTQINWRDREITKLNTEITELKQQKTELQRKVSIYESNDKIFGEIRLLKEQKSTHEKRIDSRWGSDEESIANQRDKRRIGELNEQILGLQKLLKSEPK